MPVAAPRSSVRNSPVSSSRLSWSRSRLLIAAGNGAGADDRAGDRLVAELQFDARALELVEHAGHAAVADLERELGEACGSSGSMRVVAQAGDLAAAALVDGERLEDVVHLRRVEIEARGFAGGEAAGALEVADAVLVQHHLLDGKFGRAARARRSEKESDECEAFI